MGSLFDAAAGYARDGIAVTRSLADWLAQDEPLLRNQPARPRSSFQTRLNVEAVEEVEDWGEVTADYYHYMAESVKVAFADRDKWLTDPRYVDIPIEKMISRRTLTSAVA